METVVSEEAKQSGGDKAGRSDKAQGHSVYEEFRLAANRRQLMEMMDPSLAIEEGL